MRKKKIDNNNLLPYFTDDHRDLPADYLKSCEEFFNEEQYKYWNIIGEKQKEKQKGKK
jgi:hypothetical protein